MEDFNHATERTIKRHKQYAFLECMENNFLMQVLNKLTRGDVLLDSRASMNSQSVAALTEGAVGCWSSKS